MHDVFTSPAQSDCTLQSRALTTAIINIIYYHTLFCHFIQPLTDILDF